MALTADWIRKHLGLEPHGTCGYMHETFVSPVQVPATALTAAYHGRLTAAYHGSRPMGGVFYFLVTPEAGVRLHRIRSDQMYHHYLGDPLDVLLLHADGNAAVHTMGPDLEAGMRPQLLIPGNTFHAAKVGPGIGYSLLGTSVWARADPSDVEIGDVKQLLALYPSARADIERIAQ